MRRTIDAERSAGDNPYTSPGEMLREGMSAVHSDLRGGACTDDRDRWTFRENTAHTNGALPAKRLEALRQGLGSEHGGGHRGEAISHPPRPRQVRDAPDERFQPVGRMPYLIYGARRACPTYWAFCIITISPIAISCTERVTRPTDAFSPTSTITISPRARAGNRRSS